MKSTLLDMFCSFNIDSAIHIGMSQHSQNGLDYIFHFFIGKPLFLAQHLLAHQALLDIGMVNGSDKPHLGKFERKLLGEIDIDGEFVSFIGAANWSVDTDIPVEEILFNFGCNTSE